MLRNTLRTLLALAAVSVALTANQAQAFGWRHHGWGGSWGSSGGSWGSCGSSGGSWGSCGSSGGWWHGSCGSSGGSWGSSGSCGSSGGSWGSCGSSGGYHHPSAPAAPTAPAPPAAAPPAPSDAAASNGTYHPTYGPVRNSALLSVKVPADAMVFVNDRPTTSTGVDREYISHDLQSGARYNYSVRAMFVRDGKTVTENQTIQLTAGQTAGLDFTQGDQSVQTASHAEARTTLIVHVPADAKLYLAGKETNATGEVREFSTTRLADGSEWASYAIRAVVERDGHEQVREENVSLKAGETRDVTISFDKLASDTANETAAR